MGFEIGNYNELIRNAIDIFWSTKERQRESQQRRGVQDQGSRGSVTGGKQLDGFIHLMEQVSIDVGIPETSIYTKKSKTSLPGYFRPTKQWDFVVISPNRKLVTCIEFKSQVGSFGNNFNNRTEEAIGGAVDLWTAFRKSVFPQQQPPWLGYLIVVEKSDKSSQPVRISEPHFKVLSEFRDTSYLKRYEILCRKLLLERHYSGTSLIWTTNKRAYGSISDDEVSFEAFLHSYIGHLKGKLWEF